MTIPSRSAMRGPPRVIASESREPTVRRLNDPTNKHEPMVLSDFVELIEKAIDGLDRWALRAVGADSVGFPIRQECVRHADNLIFSIRQGDKAKQEICRCSLEQALEKLQSNPNQ